MIQIKSAPSCPSHRAPRKGKVPIMLPRTMKAAVAHAYGAPLTIDEVPVPEPGPGRILVRVMASGVCHTDVHAVDGDWPVKPGLPFVPGHEGVGTVAAAGSGARGVKEGDRVGVPWLHTACGHCSYCGTGWETLCLDQKNTGYSVNGGFAEYVVADPAYVGHLPDGLDFAPAAPVLCAGVTVYKGLKETEVRPGEWVAISGIGGLGHMAVQYAKAMGMHCVAIDTRRSALALAAELGADLCINAAETDAGAAIAREIGGAHGALVTAASPEAIGMAFDSLRRKGTMALVGLPPGRFAMPIFDTVLKRITVRGSIVGTRQDLAEALQFAAEGKVVPRYTLEPLAELNAVFDRLRKGAITGRVVLNLAA
jgi:propanol-preferring alcohol dehydrogenase